MLNRILLVEDSVLDQKIALAALGKKYSVVVADTLAMATQELSRGRFDLVLLDVDLPDGNGFRYFSDLRSEDMTKDIPVFFLTMKSGAPDEVMGFTLGAEDYIVKPVDPLKLKARVEARLRKIMEQREQVVFLQNSGLKLDFNLQRAYVVNEGGEKEVELTPLEFKLLAYFMKHEDHVFSRDHLIERVWGIGTNVIDRTVDMHVSNIRRKIAASSYVIQSLRGVGYRFVRDRARNGRSLAK